MKIKLWSKAIFFFVTLCGLMDDALASTSGENIYNANCTMCHGPNGAGDGPVGKALKPSPANYNEAFKSYPSGKELKKHILDILENGKPKTAMPAFKTLPLKDRQDVTDYLMSKHYKEK